MSKNHRISENIAKNSAKITERVKNIIKGIIKFPHPSKIEKKKFQAPEKFLRHFSRDLDEKKNVYFPGKKRMQQKIKEMKEQQTKK